MFSFFNQKKSNVAPVVLVVMDGFGVAPPSAGNAVSQAKTPNLNYYLTNYPNSELIASGESVGLPANEVGNTEVGHLTMGAGRVILQELKRINLAIENGSFFNNSALLKLVAHVNSKKTSCHVLGLVGSGRVHASMDHLFATLQFLKKESVENVFLHIFTDGRDAPPREGSEVIANLERHLEVTNFGKIASVSGRYWAMDRDRRWERTERVYNALVLGEGHTAKSAVEAVNQAYAKNQTDEFIEPTLICDNSGPIGKIGDGDGVFFTNFRIDRPRQLTMAFVMPEFDNLKSFDFGHIHGVPRKEGVTQILSTFTRKKVLKDLFFVTMTEYNKNIKVSDVAYPPAFVDTPLGVVISQSGISQLRMSESEKERFVTYYFDGLREGKLPGEEIVIVQSPKVATYDLKPEMSLPKLAADFIANLKTGKYKFALINFANPDMVAHTGNLKAAITAVESADKYLGDIVDAALSMSGSVIVTADHGNIEEMLTYPNSSFFYTTAEGSVNTDHSNNPVPVIIIKSDMAKKKLDLPKKGSLSDIAPTVLGLLGVPAPAVMTGNNLLEKITG